MCCYASVPGRAGACGVGLWTALAITAAIYWPGLPGPLLLDDLPNLEPFRLLDAGVIEWHEILSSQSIGAAASRPVSMLTFVANWITTGGETWHLKYTNLMVHLLCGTLVFWVAGLVLCATPEPVANRAWTIALWVSAMWLLSPVLVSTVLYVIQRMAQLAALFLLAGLVCYLKGREEMIEGRVGRGWALLAATFLLCWPLATLSKPNGALLPLLALVLEVFLFRAVLLGPRGPSGSRPPAPERIAFRIAFTLTALSAAGVLGLLVVNPDWILGAYADRDFTLTQRLISQPRILFDYIAGLLLVPGATPLGLYHDDVAASSGLFMPPTSAIAILGWLTLLAAAWRARATRYAALGFGLVFFLAGHLVESSFIPLELYFEHRNYLPSIGVLVSIGFAIGILATRGPGRPTVGALGLVLVLVSSVAGLIGFGVATAQRVDTWASLGRLPQASVESHPDSKRVHTELANLAIQHGAPARAAAHLQRVDALDGSDRRLGTAVHLLAVYCIAGAQPPLPAYRPVEERSRRVDDVYTEHAVRWLTDRVEEGACGVLDVRRITDAIAVGVLGQEAKGSINPKYGALIHLHVARLLARLGRVLRALEHAAHAVRLRPGWPEPRILQIGIHLATGNRSAARAALAGLERLDRSSLHIYRHLIVDFERQVDSHGEAEASRTTTK